MREKGEYLSPGKTHGFDFLYENEIRFGPAYFRVKLDGKVIVNKLFGDVFKWHPESKFLALQEWLTTDVRKGPFTALFIIDLEQRKFARVSKAEQGFIVPVKFENNIIVFNKEYYGKGKTIECEIDLSKIEDWEGEG